MEQTNTETKPDVKIPCEVYSRIVGYLRPIQNWNEGKQREFADRKMFQVPKTEEK
jgi:anaerobic ribonucleoside-triphosphate reductase